MPSNKYSEDSTDLTLAFDILNAYNYVIIDFKEKVLEIIATQILRNHQRKKKIPFKQIRPSLSTFGLYNTILCKLKVLFLFSMGKKKKKNSKSQTHFYSYITNNLRMSFSSFNFLLYTFIGQTSCAFTSPNLSTKCVISETIYSGYNVLEQNKVLIILFPQMNFKTRLLVQLNYLLNLKHFFVFTKLPSLLNLIVFFLSGKRVQKKLVFVKVPFFRKFGRSKHEGVMESNDTKTKENLNTSLFETLACLPSPLYGGQCVVHKHEILICGGNSNKDCYSYHTIKDQYKYICSYPKDVTLWGHCIVKYLNDNNNNNNNNNTNIITLLSFGGSKDTKRHVLMMKYVSVWNDNEKDDIGFNKWIPLLNKSNNPIYIGKEEDNFEGARTIIGGNNNNLLFITYRPNCIGVFDLNTFQCIKHDNLPIDNYIWCHCFVSKKDNELSTASENEMLLFCEHAGLSINYNEKTNAFQYQKLQVCTTLRPLFGYACVRVDDAILFFGGYNINISSKDVHKYLIKKDKWIKFENTLPIPCGFSCGILNEDNTYIYILGGYIEGFIQENRLSTLIKTSVEKWTKKDKTKVEKQWVAEEREKRDLEIIKEDIKGLN
ncbi:hypothetical protein RFI_01613 [Reticulomyxa filosa]|uniref:Kelch domain-containing protein n=1 Tax=Reticulomyxa filosa TaxID=46433 RepID=X6PBF3_RETFI|nr:hypothetical protein RFI_01613 [Reticulomyxa filosa]|eukprot:ETO35448.1 hypothetical protein RFI_01613 [Reticulomyxa filosa]